jgi:hypothetical protein
LIANGDDSGFLIDDEDLATPYRRQDLVKHKKVKEPELSDYVKFRLWLARQLALKKRQETWG